MDDATGVVVNALFCELENTHSYFSLLDGLIRNCGIPLALYADRHAVFKYTPPSEAAATPTQFSRAMDELGVQLIFARSPQAKGRVERMAGTFQDRLVTELRLAEREQPSMTLTACSLTSSPASTNASVCHHSTQRPHIASWIRRCASIQPSA